MSIDAFISLCLDFGLQWTITWAPGKATVIVRRFIVTDDDMQPFTCSISAFDYPEALLTMRDLIETRFAARRKELVRRKANSEPPF